VQADFGDPVLEPPRCYSHLAALQAGFEDPFLEPLTHFCENILLASELYEIEISVAASMPAY
jgi:hypothetical protein